MPANWSGNANAASINVTPDKTTGGKIKVVAKRSDGTCTSFYSVNVTRPVPTKPVITGVPAMGLMCNGNATLTATAQNATSYTWVTTGILLVNGSTTYTGSNSVTMYWHS